MLQIRPRDQACQCRNSFNTYSHISVDGFFDCSISISVSPTTIKVGENVSIEGSIIPPRADVEVVIEYCNETEACWRMVANVTTLEEGNYLYMWPLQEEGKYEVRTSATIDGLKVVSPSVLVTVNEPEQPLWLYVGILAAIITIGIVTLLVYRKRTRRRRKTL